MNGTDRTGRIPELDILRGIALLLMIYFHLIFDLREFFQYEVRYNEGINFFIGRVSALLFMLISGISCSLSRSNALRGLKVLGVALVISLVSYFFNSEFVILFGILHFLGLSMILAPLFLVRGKGFLFLTGSLVMLLQYFIPLFPAKSDAGFVFGFITDTFVSSDYYPMIPWFGVFLVGLGLGKMLYAKKKSLLPMFHEKNLFALAGRRSLLIYLLHQPLLLVVLTLVHGMV